MYNYLTLNNSLLIETTDWAGIGSVLGVLLVDSKALRNHLIPITVRTLETIIALLVKHAREDCLSVLNAFQERIKQLDIRPMQLDEYVSFVLVSHNDSLASHCSAPSSRSLEEIF